MSHVFQSTLLVWETMQRNTNKHCSTHKKTNPENVWFYYNMINFFLTLQQSLIQDLNTASHEVELVDKL